ncbi:C39 family peptidase, partial [Candidatus Woesearchaeota archaeon]|nr:C39 family peptidase [Candidatus Woesearchaeota archaeon]
MINPVVFSNIAGAVTIDTGGGNRVFVPVKSFKTLRDENLVKQAYDYSCGAAALATLLTYGLGDNVTEQEVLSEAMTSLSSDDFDLRKKDGLSLLDLQRVSMVRGHKAQGFRLAPEFLSQLKKPVMVFIQPRGYEHFAVLKGVREDSVYLADPSLGNVRMPMYRFLEMWLDESGKGVIFVVERSDGRWPDNYQL